MLQLVTLPDPVLRKRAEEISVSEITTNHYQQMIKEMIQVMYEHNGIGLAAPQVAVSRRLIIVHHSDGDLAVFNPVILKPSWRTIVDEEGCLSVPGVFGTVKRHYKLDVEGYGQDGQPLTMTATGLLARVFQHEVDHINGRLFIDSVQHITKGHVPEE